MNKVDKNKLPIKAGCQIKEDSSSSMIYVYHSDNESISRGDVYINPNQTILNDPNISYYRLLSENTSIFPQDTQKFFFKNTKLNHGSRTRYINSAIMSLDYFYVTGECVLEDETGTYWITLIEGEGTINDIPVTQEGVIFTCDHEELVYDGTMRCMVAHLYEEEKMNNVYEESLALHAKAEGKLSVELKVPLETRDDLSLAYTPGVAQPCREIAKNTNDVYKYTWKSNSVAVVSDGSAVLGLGEIGPEAGLPVMEGKCVLFKKFGGVDAVPLCIDTKDPDEIIKFCQQIAPTFGGINLEDISAPRCVTIERELKKTLNIPVFHDDQHGTAIVLAAALMNAVKLVNKKLEDLTVVISGVGAAGSSIIHMMKDLGVKEIYGFGSKGIILKDDYDKYDFLKKELTAITNSKNERLTLSEAMSRSDVFIGVSVPGIINKEMVSSMKKDPIVFPMANPEPEIRYEDAKEAGAAIIGTGRSDYPNQINNVLAFPGLFRGALDAGATKITEGMKLAAAKGIASLISEEELRPDYIIPDVFDERVAKVVAEAVMKQAHEEGVIR